jgi:hypothetical protein
MTTFWIRHDVANYTKDVEAFLCCSKCKGLKHRPANLVEVMLLHYEQQERQIKAPEGIENVLRHQVSCFSHVCLASGLTLLARSGSRLWTGPCVIRFPFRIRSSWFFPAFGGGASSLACLRGGS